MNSRRPSGRLSPADLVTLASAALGFLAIAILVRYWAANPAELTDGIQVYELKLAMALIGLGALCDVADGIVARYTWSSGLGDHFDGMSDAIAFGVAPALLIAVAGLGHSSLTGAVFLAAATTHVVAVVVRLARHAAAPHAPADGFTGVTSPVGGLAVLAVLGLELAPALTIAGLLAVSALMLGRFRFPHQTHPIVWVTAFALTCMAIAVAAGFLPLRVAGAFGLFATVAIPIAARLAEVAPSLVRSPRPSPPGSLRARRAGAWSAWPTAARRRPTPRRSRSAGPASRRRSLRRSAPRP